MPSLTIDVIEEGCYDCVVYCPFSGAKLSLDCNLLDFGKFDDRHREQTAGMSPSKHERAKHIQKTFSRNLGLITNVSAYTLGLHRIILPRSILQ